MPAINRKAARTYASAAIASCFGRLWQDLVRGISACGHRVRSLRVLQCPLHSLPGAPMLDPATLPPEHLRQLLKLAQTELKSICGVIAVQLGDDGLDVLVRDPALLRKLPRLYRQVALHVILLNVSDSDESGPL